MELDAFHADARSKARENKARARNAREGFMPSKARCVRSRRPTASNALNASTASNASNASKLHPVAADEHPEATEGSGSCSEPDHEMSELYT